MIYGTYTTFDAPTQNQDKALVFLQKIFSEIGGSVRKILNPHDSGEYPSFEIDYPEHLENLNEDLDDKQSLQELDLWHDKANVLTERYNKKFEQWL